MDVGTAFLQSPVEDLEVYVRQPKGYEKRVPKGEELVCKLVKSLCGLKLSPRNWNKVTDQWMKEYGLEPWVRWVFEQLHWGYHWKKRLSAIRCHVPRLLRLLYDSSRGHRSDLP